MDNLEKMKLALEQVRAVEALVNVVRNTNENENLGDSMHYLGQAAICLNAYVSDNE